VPGEQRLDAARLEELILDPLRPAAVPPLGVDQVEGRGPDPIVVGLVTDVPSLVRFEDKEAAPTKRLIRRLRS
jgi:hypothetical protein